MQVLLGRVCMGRMVKDKVYRMGNGVVWKSAPGWNMYITVNSIMINSTIVVNNIIMVNSIMVNNMGIMV